MGSKMMDMLRIGVQILVYKNYYHYSGSLDMEKEIVLPSKE